MNTGWFLTSQVLSAELALRAGLLICLTLTLTGSAPAFGKNRLATSSSPYLLKHADNPVDWYEWGDEALAKARKEDKLIFLSIGYNACHWCNELEKECFEHTDFADIINERYVSIKVDREQRPDLDKVYMRSALAVGGHGGWPNNVFLTPQLDPIYAVGYQKRAVFKEILVKLDEYWKQNKKNLKLTGAKISSAIKESWEKKNKPYSRRGLDMAHIRADMDKKYGGFGNGSKFPVTPILEFLLTQGEDDQFLITTLDNMWRAGMFDHVGGGFHRYSVDRRWEVPHFEKMLYDNALLASLYARASVLLKKPEYAQVARHTLEFMKRELSSPQGGFFSSLDADSGGGEGKFYTWTLDEIKAVTADDPSFANDYHVTKEGNVYEIKVTGAGAERRLTGQNTLRINYDGPVTRHRQSLQKLFKARSKRARPPLDNKVVASWNALAVSAFARAGVWLDAPDMLATAEKGADFILGKLKFSHMWRNGKASGQATLDDVAFTARALWDLFEATGDEKYLSSASRYVDYAMKNFSDGHGEYYFVKQTKDLIARPKVTEDNPLPSSSSALARIDWRLGVAFNQPERIERSMRTARQLLGALGGANIFSGETMNLYEEISEKPVEVVYAFEPKEANAMAWISKGAARQWGIVRIPLGAKSISPALAQGRLPAGKTTAYVCVDNSCLEPSGSPDQVTARLADIRKLRAGGKAVDSGKPLR